MLNLLKNMSKIFIISLCAIFLFAGCSRTKTIATAKDPMITSQSTDTSSQVQTQIKEPTQEQTKESTQKLTQKPIQESTQEPTQESTLEPIKESDAWTYTVAIDAGHQSKGNSEQEPIGPNSSISKPKVSSGTQGIITKIPEYQLTLVLSFKLRDELEAQGYKVIMVRQSNDVNISNKERAEIATNAEADIFIRIHADGSDNQDVNGILTLSPTKNNPHVSELYADSRRLSNEVLNAMVDSTNAKNRGVSEVDNMSGINWSTMPVTIVEVGLMTNPTEDKLMQTDEYQNKLIEGMVNGINNYFRHYDINLNVTP